MTKDDGAVGTYKCMVCGRKFRAWIEVTIKGVIQMPSCCGGWVVKVEP